VHSVAAASGRLALAIHIAFQLVRKILIANLRLQRTGADPAMSDHKLTRREVLARMSAAAVTAALPGANGTPADAKPASYRPLNVKKGGKPNVLWITSEGIPLSVIGCYGSKLMSTPNIDRLAKEGMRFDNSFTTNALCAPSRAVLLTG